MRDHPRAGWRQRRLVIRFGRHTSAREESPASRRRPPSTAGTEALARAARALRAPCAKGRAPGRPSCGQSTTARPASSRPRSTRATRPSPCTPARTGSRLQPDRRFRHGGGRSADVPGLPRPGRRVARRRLPAVQLRDELSRTTAETCSNERSVERRQHRASIFRHCGVDGVVEGEVMSFGELCSAS